MIFWTIITLLLEIFVIFLIMTNFPLDSILVSVFILTLVTIWILINSFRKVREYRTEKLEKQIRRLIAQNDELKSKLMQKGEN